MPILTWPLPIWTCWPSVRWCPQVSAAFDEYWNSTHAYPVSALFPPAGPEQRAALKATLAQLPAQKETEAYVNALEHSDLIAALHKGSARFAWAEARVFHDTAEKSVRGEGWRQQLLISQLWPYLDAVTDELIIVSPYFVPLENGTDALCKISERGATVRILTNSLASNDVSAVHAGYAPYREQLLKAGVILYELDEDIRTKIGKRFTWLPGLEKVESARQNHGARQKDHVRRLHEPGQDGPEDQQ